MKIKGFVPRLYQETIFSSCSQKNSLVVLPTGLGKTNVFLMLAAHRLTLYPNKKVLLLGPTRPLIEQYFNVFMKYLEIKESDMAIMTGMIKPEKRKELFEKSKIIFSTPQGLENDIVNKSISLKEVCLLGIDEAHRAVGDYAYVFVTKMYQKDAEFPLTIGLTASPGSDMEKIEEVAKNLFVENIELRTNEDPDVKPYIKEVEVEWVKVKLNDEMKKIQERIQEMLKDRFQKLKDSGVLKRKNVSFVSRKDILSMQAELRGRALSGEKDFVLWSSISLLAEIMKIFHGLELLESQGIMPLYQYFDGIYKESFKTKTKATINIGKDTKFREVLIRLENLVKEKVRHPKIYELERIIMEEISNNKEAKILIFNQYRDNVSYIKSQLERINGVKASIFVGQAKKNGVGLSQKDQKELIENFSNGDFNVVVSTSIGEEGLDIPKVDTVIFFEPVPSAIRSIQRRGRTGRLDKGKVIVLMTESTRDESYKWSAHHKEKRMYRNIGELNKKLKEHNFGLNKYIENKENDKIKIIVDHREKASNIVKLLIELGIDIEFKNLEYSDYVLSSRVGIEYKKVEDFVNSIVDGRLMIQVKDLKRTFERPLVIIEGEEDMYSIRNIHPNAIRGMISNITVSYCIPIIRTKNPQETAEMMKVIARREQLGVTKEFEMHFEKKKPSMKEQLEYFVSAVPMVGISTAKELLKEFGTVKKIVNAKEDALKKVDKVGEKTAKNMKTLFEKDYNSLE